MIFFQFSNFFCYQIQIRIWLSKTLQLNPILTFSKNRQEIFECIQYFLKKNECRMWMPSYLCWWRKCCCETFPDWRCLPGRPPSPRRRMRTHLSSRTGWGCSCHTEFRNETWWCTETNKQVLKKWSVKSFEVYMP